MKKFGIIAFWVLISILITGAVFFLGDMLDLVKYPQYAFAGSIVLIVALLIGYFAGKNKHQ